MSEALIAPKEIDERELLHTVQAELDSGLGWAGTRLASARRQNLDEYFGNPRGDEREGRSQVVCRDTFEQVEMLLPPLMEIFTSGTETGRFIPEGPEDEAAAAQATAHANYVVRSQDGFMVLYTMFKDALIQKNGIVKVYWDEGGVATPETYEGKTFEELRAILSNPKIEIRAVTPWRESAPGQIEELAASEAGVSYAPEEVFYDVSCVRHPSGRIALENVPPEEFVINRDAASTYHRTCRFVGHRARMTVSDVIAMGVDAGLARRLPSAHGVFTNDQDAIVRASQDDGNPLLFAHRKDEQRIVLVGEYYILKDLDGDGVSEWYKVLAGGEYAQVLLDYEPVDGHPFASVTPIPIPHRFYGLSVADVTSDLQNINGTLWRQLLDATYLSIDPSYVVYSQGVGDQAVPMVNLNQLVRTSPGSYVEEFERGALRALERTNNLKDILPAFEIHNAMKERRTGISPEAMGVNPESISKHVFGAMVQTSAAAQRVSLYARIFADTGVKDIFRLIYKLMLKKGTAPSTVRLRGDWVTIDPTSWKDNWDVQITVGLGHGSRMEKVSNLQTVAALQQAVGTAFPGMVGPEQAFNTFAEMVEGMGFKDATKFIVDPASGQLPPPEPPPEVQALQYQREIEMMKLEIDRQKVEVERYKAMVEAKAKELAHEVEIKKLALEGAKLEYDAKEFDINRSTEKQSAGK